MGLVTVGSSAQLHISNYWLLSDFRDLLIIFTMLPIHVHLIPQGHQQPKVLMRDSAEQPGAGGTCPRIKWKMDKYQHRVPRVRQARNCNLQVPEVL